VYTEHLRIPVGAGSLHAERVGRGGHPIILLHGYGTCAFLWRGIAPRLADAGYTAIAFDMLGYGESDRPLDMPYGLAAQAEYIERALTALRLPAVTVVGQDIGGVVALLLAAQRTRRVARLTLINPPDLQDLPGPEVRLLQRTSARAALSANALFGALTLLDPLLRAGVAEPAHMSERLVARYLAPYVGGEGVGHLLQLASALELSEDDQPRPGDVRAPALIVRGEKDPWTTDDSVSSVSAQLPAMATETISLPNVGHLVAEDAPEGLTTLIREWIEGRAEPAISDDGRDASNDNPRRIGQRNS
jgi:pimeloyl-ACP methyl ester carboxylesterase